LTIKSANNKIEGRINNDDVVERIHIRWKFKLENFIIALMGLFDTLITRYSEFEGSTNLRSYSARALNIILW
jgi:hypothetical protein